MRKKRVTPPEAMVIERGKDCIHIYHKEGKHSPVLAVYINGHEYKLPRYGTLDLLGLPAKCKWAVGMKEGDKIPIIGTEDINNALDTFFNY